MTQWGQPFTNDSSGVPGYVTSNVLFPVKYTTFVSAAAACEYSYTGGDTLIRAVHLDGLNSVVNRSDFSRTWIAIGV